MAGLVGLGQSFGAPGRLINVGAPVGIGQAIATQTQGLNQLGAGVGGFLRKRKQDQLEDADRALLGQALDPAGGAGATADSLSKAIEGFQSVKFRGIADQLMSQRLTRQLDPTGQQQRRATLGLTGAQRGKLEAETEVLGREPQKPGFTLGPGQERFGPGGEPIAQVPAAPATLQRGVPFTTPEGKTVFIDPTTGKQIPTDLPLGATSPLRPQTTITVGDARVTTNSLTLGRSFRTDERIKDMRTIEKFTQNMVTAFERSLKQPKNFGPIDIALAKSFQKLTDLGSTVREGEFATTFEGQTLINKIRGKAQSVIKGGLGFTPEDRKELVDLALALQEDSRKLFNQAITEFTTTSAELGLNTRAVLGGVKPFDISPDQQQGIGGQDSNLASQLRPGEILVRDKATGQTGALPEGEFDPNLFERVR